MRTKLLPILCVSLLFPAVAHAGENMQEMDEHPSLFHAFMLETDIGHSREEGLLSKWHLNGWAGGDYHKLAIKSEGEASEGETHHAEFWGMYSGNVAEFWDIQAGMRYDAEPDATTYLVVGVQGLAPYFFETEAHLFVSDEGDISARIRQEQELLLTQKLVLQPYAEVNLYAQDIPEQDIGTGLAGAEIGIQTRYEITRKFAPYVDVRYERSFGETSSIAKNNGKSPDDVVVSAGLRLMF